jgi:Leucine-rich repeat (LRR) protein
MTRIIDKIQAEKDTIKKINLSEQYSLTEIPEIIGQCFQLEKLDISFTSISEIPDFIFQLPNLKELNYLGCKKLQNQPKCFSSQQPLEKLSIYIGKHQTIPAEFENLTNLKSLVLSGELKEIPKSIYNLATIEDLEIFDTKISIFSTEIEKLSNLKKVSFWQSLFLPSDKPISLNLEEIFQNLSKCNNLKELYLNRNGIDKVPENIQLLSQLQTFSAKENLLKSYPNSLYKLTNLKELDFGVNQLKEVSKGIGKLTQLKTLRLNSNWKNNLDTKNLFDEIDELINLETLELFSCQSVKEIPETISKLKKLKKLDLDNNLLEKLPKSILSMTQLKILRVSTNRISSEEINELKRHLTTTKIIA